MKLAALIGAAGAALLMTAAVSTPADAHGWRRGCCGCTAVGCARPIRHYRPVRFYRPVRYYRPVRLYRPVHYYRPVRFYRPWRHCHRW